MMASMLSSTPARVSQKLPIPKCSTCNQFVPLEELGDHICALTSPVPKPAMSSAAAAALLPKRLQGRTPSPGPRGSTSRPASPSPTPRGPPASKLPVKGSNSPTKVTFQPRPSPLAASKRVGSKTTNAVPSRDTRLSINTSSSILTRLPQVASSNTSATSTTSYSTPTTARPYFIQDSTPTPIVPASNRGGPPLGHRGPLPAIPRSGTPANMVPTRNSTPPLNAGSPAPQKIVDFSGTARSGVEISDSPRQHFVPPPERGIDTKTGGEAGMAGVGRRGFAAAARAAMFAAPPGRPLVATKPNPPNYLDMDRPTETPPLSAGSGYSSHSPGPSSPLPQLEFTSQPVTTKITRTPSPPDSTPTQTLPASSDPIPSSALFPFLDRFKNKIPGNSSTSDSPNTANNDPSSSFLNSSTSAPTSVVPKDTSDSAMLYRTVTSSTNSSRQVKDVRRPISPVDSESEYGGLAYADSTDYEDNDGELSRPQSKNSSSMHPFVLRTGSSTSSHRYRYISGSEYSEYNDDRTGVPIAPTRQRPGHTRNGSTSSVSSAGGGSHTRDRANSSVIAQALGLSQTPPSDYKKLGGPGVMGMGGRRRESSISRRNAGPESIEEMAKALEEAKIKTRTNQPSFGSPSQRSHLHRTESNSTSTTASSRKGDNVIGSGPKAHRSNTIQNPHPGSPEGKAVKLPMRSLTSPKVERDKTLDGTDVKERVRKPKVCLKCQNVIDNGRWVSVDGGGVLCEKCWKKMYLPKCRRCNLSIEKQAVSSSDGQLKGKYHKECFNCDTCHKPFPDKTFYVYDGKPLCAYHYHEANDSLCAAALCGQPIEGPCAVSHSGDRYHPEHMTCEHSGYPPCKQMLSEYWEIDGRMLCERHAHSASVRGSDEEDEEWAKSTRAKKRVTRFIDLAGGVGGSGGGAGLGDGGLI